MAVLQDQRLLVVSGKGGVGKSAVAAALALASARNKRRTLVCEVNTDERVPGLLGHPPVGPEVRQIEPHLWAVDVRPDEAMREYALMILKFERVYKAVFENRLVKYFLRFVGGIQELVLLGKILFHLREKREDGTWRFERIIVDAPATGHALTLLGIAKVLLDTVPPGPLQNEARWMNDALVDPKTTAALLVSLPEEMPVNETIELGTALRSKLSIHPRLVVLNSFYEPRFTDEELAQLEKTPAALHAARVHQVRAKVAAEARERLARGLNLPVTSVPRFFDPDFGRAQIERIAAFLEPCVEEP